MPTEFPYMSTSGNIGAILDKLKTAGTPPKFTNQFLQSLGFTSSNDRGMIKVLKHLGFLDNDGIPTERYQQYRHPERSAQVLAQALRDGWREAFLVDTKLNEKGQSQLAGIFGSVTGKGEAVAQKMASTFRALADRADFTAEVAEPPPPVPPADTSTNGSGTGKPSTTKDLDGAALSLHQDIHIHLPATTDVAVFTAIFRALRNELLD